MASKYADRAKKPEEMNLMPKTCGVSGCCEPCGILVGYNNIARCLYHYQRDVDNYRGKRKSASSFVYDKGMPRS